MPAVETWSTDWSRRRAAARSDLCALSHIGRDIQTDVQQMMLRTIDGPRPSALSLEVIAAKRQSASLLDKGAEAVVLFDLSQSRILKRLIELVCRDAPYDESAKLLAGAAAVAVSDESPDLAGYLLDLIVPAQAEYVHSEAQIIEDYGHLRATLPRFLFEWHSSLVDSFLLAHEVSHFLLRRPNPLMNRIKAEAEAAFDFALEQVCYERRPDFAAIALRGGIVVKSDQALAVIRDDLSTRRAHYEATRDEMVEEIACDAYGLHMAALTHEAVWKSDPDDLDLLLDGYMRLAQTYFLLFALSDLHQAIIKRAKLSVAGGVQSKKPGHIADMHFRKMALLQSIAWQAFKQIPEDRRAPRGFERLLHDVVPFIGRQKQSLDSLVTAPVTRVVKNHIVAFERGPRQDEAGAAGESMIHRRNDLRELFGVDWIEATFTSEGGAAFPNAALGSAADGWS